MFRPSQVRLAARLVLLGTLCASPLFPAFAQPANATPSALQAENAFIRNAPVPE